MKLNLVIKGEPRPKQSARFAKVGKFMKSYQSEEVVQEERNIKWDIKSQLPKGFVPFNDAIIVHRILYVFPPLKRMSKSVLKSIENGETVYKTSKPDLTDNLNKGLIDAMQGIVFLNDSQICEVRNMKKVYGFVPRIEIDIEGNFTNQKENK